MKIRNNKIDLLNNDIAEESGILLLASALPAEMV
tara:strand:+ start:709 stop:810 length:102 start_codon:yes stop_codon:yes gene_type:complete